MKKNRLPTGYPKCTLCGKGILRLNDRQIFEDKVYHTKCLKAIGMMK